MYRFWAHVVLTALLLIALPALAEEESVPEVWNFRNGEIERQVDVTKLPDFVREAIVLRLRAEGFERVITKDGSAGGAPASGRDLEEDVRRLVRQGGRFPELRTQRSAASVEAARRALLDALPEPPRQGDFFGACVRTTRDPKGRPQWRILSVREGSLAAALGLETGDRVTRVDDGPATLEALRRLESPARRPRQLVLGVLRREGRFETWELTFAWGGAEAAPAPHTENR